MSAAMALRGGIVPREPSKIGIDLDQHEPHATDAARQRQARGADAGAEIRHPVAQARGRRRCQQFRVGGRRDARTAADAAAIARRGKASSGEAADAVIHRRATRPARPRSAAGAGLQIVVLMHQNPPRQDAERAFDDAHVLVQHEVMDIGAVEQRADRRNQHDIVGSNQFPQFSSFSHSRPDGAEPLSPHPALAAPARAFYCSYKGSMRFGQMWRPAWRLLYPSRAPKPPRSSSWSCWSPPTWSVSTPPSCRAPARRSP